MYTPFCDVGASSFSCAQSVGERADQALRGPDARPALVTVVPHAVWPAGQAQFEPEHVAPLAQALPHVPQLFGSVALVVQKALPPEPHASGVEGGQMDVHTPVTQLCDVPQTFPQVVQFALSVCVFAQ